MLHTGVSKGLPGDGTVNSFGYKKEQSMGKSGQSAAARATGNTEALREAPAWHVRGAQRGYYRDTDKARSCLHGAEA